MASITKDDHLIVVKIVATGDKCPECPFLHNNWRIHTGDAWYCTAYDRRLSKDAKRCRECRNHTNKLWSVVDVPTAEPSNG